MLWAKIFWLLQVFYFLPYCLNAVIGSQDKFFFVQHTMAALGVSITILILVLRPDILYGLKGVVVRNFKSEPVIRDVETVTTNPDEPGIRFVTATETTVTIATGGIYLSGQKLSGLGKQLTEHIVQQRSYLKKR